MSATETPTLTASARSKGSKSQLLQMRKNGEVPAVLYGLQKEPVILSVKYAEIRPHLQKRNHMLELDFGGSKEQVLVKVIDRDPIRDDILHIDFLRVDDSHPVVARVPVTTSGIPVGVKTQGGVFSVMKKWVRVRSKVQDIPEVFSIDVSNLNAGTIFYVRDLKFEKGTFVTPQKTALFGVSSGRKAEEEAAAAAPAKGAPAAKAAAPAAAKGAAPAAKPAGKK